MLGLLRFVRDNPYVVLRIVLRYAAGSGAAAAILSDYDLMAVAAFALGGLAEAGYSFARKRGGQT